MRITFRLILSLVVGVTLVASLFDFLQVRRERERLKDELERRAVVQGESLAQSIEPSLEQESPEGLLQIAGTFGNRERLTGVAVYDTLKEFGLKPDIKWVNDILIGDDKICGILAETVETPTGVAVVVGIGINLTSSSFPEEIAETATSIEVETGNSVTADELAERLTHYLSYFYDILNEVGGSREILRHWQQRSTYFSGKRVRVTLDGSTFEGTTDGLEENGALRVKTTDGSVTIVQAGDVERLRRI